MQLRVARHTNRLEELVRFYRDGLGLAEIGRFDDHEGYNGVFLAVPGTEAHLEFTSGGPHEPPAPNPETLLVLYLDSHELESLPANDFPHVIQAAPHLATPYHPERVFEQGLDLLRAGIETHRRNLKRRSD